MVRYSMRNYYHYTWHACREEAIRGDHEIEAMYADAELQRLGKHSLVDDVLNISHVLTDGAAAMVDDSFNKCFTMIRPEPWNWNIYLYPCWVLGVLLRCVRRRGRLGCTVACHAVSVGLLVGKQLPEACAHYRAHVPAARHSRGTNSRLPGPRPRHVHARMLVDA